MYEGERASDGSYHGRGKYTWDDGSYFEGNWKNGSREGQGAYYWSTGNRYLGGYKNDKRNGWGTMVYKQGDVYQGEFVQDALNGSGSYWYSNGDRYDGEWLNGKMDGRGIFFKYATSSFFDCEWIEGNPVRGVWFRDGHIYEGELQDSKPHGSGIYTFSDGISKKGKFRNGAIVKETVQIEPNYIPKWRPPTLFFNLKPQISKIIPEYAINPPPIPKPNIWWIKSDRPNSILVKVSRNDANKATHDKFTPRRVSHLKMEIAKTKPMLAVDKYGFILEGETTQELQNETKKLKKNSVEKENVKWEELINSLKGNYDKIKANKTVKKLICLYPIPPDSRGEIWPRFTSGYTLCVSNPTLYAQMLKQGSSNNPYSKQIELDLPRTFPTNAWFMKEEVQASLKRVLLAFSSFKPEIGYCQAMNFLVASFLFFVQEELAFWMLVSVIEDLLPPNFYAEDLMGIRVSVETFRLLFDEKFPKFSKLFSHYSVDPGVFAYQWFMCLFVTALPIEGAMMFLDSFFYYGHVMLYQTALAMFKLHKKKILELSDTIELLSYCRNLPSITDWQLLMATSHTIKINETKLLELSKQALGNITAPLPDSWM